MTGVVKVLDGSGHTDVEFDTAVPESLEVAAETINRRMATGAMLFDTTAKPGRQMGRFDPEVSEQMLVPQFAGG